MDVSSYCPFSIGALFWQPRPGAWAFTIVCKATYHLLPGAAELSQHQEPVQEADRHYEDDLEHSLYSPTDLVPFKPRADVLLVGRAFADDGVPAHSILARLAVGTIDKSLEVSSPRGMNERGEIVRGAPITKRSIRYERAGGGPGTANPVGIPAGLLAGENGIVLLPDIQPPGLVVRDPAEPVPPIGFGPISPSWPERAAKIKGCGADLGPLGWLSRPLPAGLLPGWFNSAPPDQQLDRLYGTETLAMDSLHPQHPRLRTRLPGLRPRVVIECAGGARPLDAVADTLWIDTDRSIATLVWRARSAVHHPLSPGRVVVTLDGPDGARIPSGEPTLHLHGADIASWWDLSDPSGHGPRTARLSSPSPSPESLADTTQQIAPAHAPGSSLGDSALPFRASPPPPRPALVAIVPPAAPVPSFPSASREEARSLGQQLSGRVSGATSFGAPTGQASSSDTSAASPVPERRPREIVELLWYDPAALPRIRRTLCWKKILADLKPRPSDDDFDGGLSPEQMKAAKDRRDVRGVLARGEIMDFEAIRRAMEMAVAEDGSFVPPYVLTAGTLELLCDEVETLRALLTVVTPFIGGDKKLQAAVDEALAFLKVPGAENARGVAEIFAGQVREAFSTGRRAQSTGFIDQQLERMLAEARCFKKETALGRTSIQATAAVTGSDALLPFRIDSGSIAALPPQKKLTTRVLAEARFVAGGPGPHAVSLQAVGLGSVVQRP